MNQIRKFDTGGRPIELGKLLKVSGLCSTGGEAKMLIAAGEVFVDGEPEYRRRHALIAGQTVVASDVELQLT